MFYKLLEGVRVVEYGELVTAPFCARILADLGAEVIKIEEPGHGDPARRREPFLDDIPGDDRGGLFLYANMNKLGITLNLKTATGRQILAELLRSADAFVENHLPRRAEELGISYHHVREVHHGIIVTSITPFGQTGPYRDFKGGELIVAHLGGAGYASTLDTDVSQEPIKLPGQVFGFQTGLWAAAATSMALYCQGVSGEGEHIDVSEYHTVAFNIGSKLPWHFLDGVIPSRTNRAAVAPFHIVPCKDGHVVIAFLQDAQWKGLLRVMGNPEWGDNELFSNPRSRGEYWDALRPLIVEWTMQHGAEEIYHSCQLDHVPVGAVYTVEGVLRSQQRAARGFFVEVEHPETGALRYPGVPYSFSGVPREAPRPAPLLGQHNEEIYCGRLGHSKRDLARLRQAGII